MTDMTSTYSYDERTVSDLHKDAYGFRPSSAWFEQWSTFTPDQKQEEWDYLIIALEQSMAADVRREEAAMYEYDRQLRELMHLGAPSREAAIRWMLDSMDLDEYDLRYGGDYICYKLGLPYSFQSEFDPTIHEMLAVKEMVDS